MIKNEKQYKISKASLNKFKGVLDTLELNPSLNLNVLLRAEYDGVRSQYDELANEIDEYEGLLNKEYKTFDVFSIENFPQALIKARIFQNLSQKEFATKLGLKEQQIQRYEATDYSTASFERIKEIAKELNVGFDSRLFVHHNTQLKTIIEKIIKAGFSKEFIFSKLIPLNLKEKIASYDECKDSEQKSIVSMLTIHLSRLFQWDIKTILDPNNNIHPIIAIPNIRYKLVKNSNTQKINAQSLFYLILARHLLSNIKPSSQKVYLKDSLKVRSEIVKKYGSLNLENTIDYVWSLGIPVIPIRNNKSFHGACIRIEGKNIIVLSQNTNSESRLLFDLIHELYHAIQDPDEKDIAIFEEKETEIFWQNEEEEIEANKFAGDVLLDGKAEILAQKCVKEASGKIPYLKSSVTKVANKENLSVASLANYMAYRLMLQNINWWGTANNLQIKSDFHWSILLNAFFKNVDLNQFEEPYKSSILNILRED